LGLHDHPHVKWPRPASQPNLTFTDVLTPHCERFLDLGGASGLYCGRLRRRHALASPAAPSNCRGRAAPRSALGQRDSGRPERGGAAHE
jgi:hypothetical protein